MTTALPSRTADRDLREKRYVSSQAVRLVCFLAGALLPLPMPARLALLAASIALPCGAVVAANAGPARTRRRVHATVPAASATPPPAATEPAPAPTAGAEVDDQVPHESLWSRVRWRVSYTLLQAYGPAQLSGDSDPRQQMLTERATGRRLSGPVSTRPLTQGRDAA